MAFIETCKDDWADYRRFRKSSAVQKSHAFKKSERMFLINHFPKKISPMDERRVEVYSVDDAKRKLQDSINLEAVHNFYEKWGQSEWEDMVDGMAYVASFDEDTFVERASTWVDTFESNDEFGLLEVCRRIKLNGSTSGLGAEELYDLMFFLKINHNESDTVKETSFKINPETGEVTEE